VSATDKPHVEVDFRRRDTETGWLGTLDRFGLAAAPIWFEWLEWVLVLGAFEYLAIKTGAGVVRFIVLASIGLLWFYFNGFFYRIHFKGWFRIQSRSVERVVSIIVSGLLAMIFWFAVQATAHAIAANTK
jgi:hypothetical protein